ncbi:MAG TPA: glycosyltransferase family 2 protein [Candidatus Omnitrophota bacterium]|nr:glycosyltransferase family 2 protein [Candidatus Omnitrophota bacterium]HPS21090.1 glycosyltransferase family 2 protein [Candidatus Omnitrophota bacterium]
MKYISVVSQCYNEEGNVRAIYEEVKKVINSLDGYRYEHIFIDNNSQDKTREILREMAREDKNVKVIFNARNFGQIRSPLHGMMQAGGDAVISIVSDLQEPPAMIADFVKNWEKGYKVVIGIKNQSEESQIFYAIRTAYYNMVSRLSEIELAKNFTGFGLYDREVIEAIRSLNDPYPYFRGLICDLGFKRMELPYVQPKRRRGITKNNFYILYDYAMLGITSHSKVPLRLATMFGFLFAVLSLLIAFCYLIYKLIFWQSFSLGVAPIVVGLFFFISMELFFLGIIGEYVGAIHTQVLKRPLVIESERINFDPSDKR